MDGHRRHPGPGRGRRNAAVLAFVAAGLGPAGCDTIGQDLSDFGQSLTPPTPAEAARMAVDPFDPDNRRQGTLLLANATFGGDDVYLRMYRDYVDNEEDPLVKAVAIRALARHGTPEDAAAIMRYLAHENVQVRWEAAKGLQRLHNDVAIPPLLESLGNVEEHSDVRCAAACALGQYPQDRVFQGLVASLDDRDLALNVAAERSLETLTGRSFGMDRLAWLEWYGENPAAAFADQQDYLYPTYTRDDSFLEKLAFWTSRNFESPSTPAGLEPAGRRSTYDDEAGAGDPDQPDGSG